MNRLRLGLIAASLFTSLPAAAQLPPPTAAEPAAAPAPPPPTGLPPPMADTTGAQGAGPQPSAASGSDWKFSWSGYFRAPLRIGVGSRPACPPGVSPATQAQTDYRNYQAALGAANGADVTGGMESKVREMLALVQEIPGLTVRIFSGEQPGNIQKALAGEAVGTLISA